MLHMIRDRKVFSIVLSALVVLGLWSNAMAALLCPHMIGGDCCLTTKAKSAAHQHHGDSRSSATHDHMDHMKMSGMDMDISASEMGMNETETPLPTLNRDLSYNVGSGAEATLVAISEEPGPCSHCEMHFRSGATFPVSVAGQSSVSYQIIAPDAATATLRSIPSVPAFFELHEHGPPGSQASPVYILISAFRI